ncbi:MAG: thiamine pyrophosphate-dependent enzyme, partial [Planctomycetota bacterium]
MDASRPDHYIVVHASPDRYDRAHAVTMRIQAAPAEVARTISEKIGTHQKTSYFDLMLKISKQADAVIDRRVKSDTQLSEPFVARHLSAIVPHDSCLFLSNSMPVRDMDLDLYGVNNRGSVFSTANRGVSGIDGIISTAIGITTARRSPTTLVIGDIAFLYDLNALAFLTGRALPIIVVVINNQGGGIFDFLPISECQDVLEKFFVAKHDFQFSGV